jgi:predicted glycoside hydrolase/deacetylase ChbG (UPF0249 family)
MKTTLRETKKLIVNADDYGLTDGVTDGILHAFREGIVSSASIMATGEDFTRAALLAKDARLPLGLHLTLTWGKPLSAPQDVPTLLKADGRFKRPEDYRQAPPSPREAAGEWEKQLNRLKEAGLCPDHLDSHHFVYELPEMGLLEIAADLAARLNLPLRQTREASLAYLQGRGLETPDFFCGAFYGEGVSTAGLTALFAKPWQGVAELMCHPGQNTDRLAQISSYTEKRAKELAILTAPGLGDKLVAMGIETVSFADLQKNHRGNCHV